MSKKLILIDGNSIAFRAFYALPLLSNAAGVYTNAVYGFATMLLKLLEDEKPSHMFVAFDAGKVTHRHTEYKEYKGGRQKTPSELSGQFPVMKEMLDRFGIKREEVPGYEADDIIGTLTKIADQQGVETLVVTGDKDMLQLVSDNVKVLLTRKGISEVDRFDIEAIKEKYGLSPQQIIDLKGLMGDASDNIPGVPGVGEKTALKLLQEYGSVEEVLNHIDEVSGKKLQENLSENKKQAIMSKELATIFREMELDLSLDELKFETYNPEQLFPFFEQLEFKSLLDRLGSDVQKTTETEELAYTVVTKDNMSSFVAQLTSPMYGHLEIDGTNSHNGTLIGLALANDNNVFYISEEMIGLCKELQEWLSDSSQKKVFHDSKRTRVAFCWKNYALDGVVFDTELASYIINPTEANHELSQVASREAGFALPSDDEVYGKGAKRSLLEGEALAEHVCRKAVAVKKCYPVLEKALKEFDQEKLYYDMELPLSTVLADMEIQGVKVDRAQLEEMGVDFDQRLNELTQQIYAMAGTEFNINSPKQMGDILFDKLRLPVIKKTKTGYSTNVEVLEKLEPRHEIIGKILTFRQLGKLQSTYVEGLKKVIRPDTSKIHTTYQQTLAATGRLSSIDPNLQNIPIRLEEGRRLRQIFIPSERDWKILAADYSQIELRVLAHISDDDNLKQAFIDDQDVHTRTAMEVFNVGENEVTSLMRRHAKAVNFGIVYGISEYGLSQSLNISRREAGEFIERYLNVFEGVRQFMHDIVKTAKDQGYVTTLLNRRRYLPDIRSSNFNLRSAAERTAMNTPIQGTAADIIKLAMVKMAHELEERNLKSRMLLQVHDELVFEVHPNELEIMKELVCEVMEGAIDLNVPLKVDVSYGDTWYDAK